MSDSPPPLRPASPVRKTAVRAAKAGVNLIWLVPIFALVVTLAIFWNSYSNRGPVIEVEFEDATGITPGETVLRFREINVGQVEGVEFTDDLSKVVVEIRVEPEIAQYIDTDAAFWIVRPQVTAQGVTRLDTVLSGSFIEGYWDSKIAQKQTHFTGSQTPPLIRDASKGTWVTLTTESADGLSDGAPVLYHGVQVGRMENVRLADDGNSVELDAFIESPHDERLTTSTVFWDASGFSLSLGAQGVAFNVNSLSSLLQGGVSFDTLISGGQPIEPGHVYPLQPDEESARNNLFTEDQSGQLMLTMLVDSTVTGLEQGADVKFLGLNVGKVTGLGVRIEEGIDGGSSSILQEVTLAISPRRLGLPAGATPEDALEFLQNSVKSGLRATVATAGFFGSSLSVELEYFTDPPEAEIALEEEPYPVIPAIEGNLDDFTHTAEGFLDRIGGLPIEEVLRSATDMMDSVTALASSQDTRAIPAGVRKAVDEAQAALTEVRQIAADFNESETATKIGPMVEEATKAFEAVELAAADVPEMVDEIDAIAADVGEMDFAAIGAQAEGILADIRAILGTEDAEALPRNLSATLEASTKLLNELSDGDAAGSLNNLLDSASVAADEIAKAVQQVPQLVQRLESTAARAESVLAAYGDRSAFNSEAVNMLRELRRATESFGSLARMIERNPRAFILGR